MPDRYGEPEDDTTGPTAAAAPACTAADLERHAEHEARAQAIHACPLCDPHGYKPTGGVCNHNPPPRRHQRPRKRRLPRSTHERPHPMSLDPELTAAIAQLDQRRAHAERGLAEAIKDYRDRIDGGDETLAFLSRACLIDCVSGLA